MTAISLYVARDEDGNDVGSFYAECGLNELSIEEFYLEIPDETGELDKQKKLVAARKLFLAIVDHEGGREADDPPAELRNAVEQ